MIIDIEDFPIIADALGQHPDIDRIDTVEQTIRLRDWPHLGDIDAAIVFNNRPDLLEDAVTTMHADLDLELAEHALEILDAYIREIAIGDGLTPRAPQLLAA